MELILLVILSYLLGSIPFALVIGKLFYKTDIRRHGSGNLGGGNTGRVLGAKAGVAVMTLDILKVTLAVFLAVGSGAAASPLPWPDWRLPPATAGRFLPGSKGARRWR